ncbi:hypothetical protein ABG067_005276 [Albugo candida]
MDDLEDFQCFTESLDTAAGFTHESSDSVSPLFMSTLPNSTQLGDPMFGFDCAPLINSQEIPLSNSMVLNNGYGRIDPQPNTPNHSFISEHDSLNFIDDESMLDCIIKSTQLLKSAIAGSYDYGLASCVNPQPIGPPSDILKMNVIDECLDTIIPSESSLAQFTAEFNMSEPQAISDINISDVSTRASDTQNIEEKKESILTSTTTEYTRSADIDSHEPKDKNMDRAKSTGRMRRKDELAYLRTRVVELETELSKLKKRNQQSNHSVSSHGNVLHAFSMWKRIAVRQKTARENAQTEHMRLSELLKRQLRIAHGLENLLRKRPQQALKDPKWIKALNTNNKTVCNINKDALLWSQNGTYDQVLKQLRECAQLLKQKKLLNSFEDVSENSVSHRSDGRILVETRESFLLPFALERVNGVKWDTRDTIRKPGQGFQKTIKSTDNSLIQEMHRFITLYRVSIPIVTILTLIRTAKNADGYMCWQNNGQVDFSSLFAPSGENTSSAPNLYTSHMYLESVNDAMSRADFEHVCVREKGWSMLQKVIKDDGTVDEESCHLIWCSETELFPKKFGRRDVQESLVNFESENPESIKDECMNVLANMYRNLSVQDSPVLNRILESLVLEDSKQSEYQVEEQ